MSIVRLSNPHAARYTPQQREETYLLWRTVGGRSLRKTAEATGISAATLSNWSRDEGWAERATRDDAEDAALLRSSIGSLILTQAGKSLDTIVALRDDPATPPKVRLDASVYLAGLAGIAELHRGGTQVLPQPTGPAGQLTDELIAAMTAEERRAWLNQDR